MPKQHDTREMRKLFKEIEEHGFSISRSKKGVYKIYPPEHITGPMYSTHGTQATLHPIRRDFKKLYMIELSGV